DGGVADGVEIFHQGAQAVAVGDDDDLAAGAHGRRDGVVPVREESRDRILEAFGERKLGAGYPRVARISERVARVASLQGGPRCVLPGAPASPPPLALIRGRPGLFQSPKAPLGGLLPPARSDAPKSTSCPSTRGPATAS